MDAHPQRCRVCAKHTWAATPGLLLACRAHSRSLGSERGVMKTRFICTIGPRTVDQESLARLHASGMNIARVNGAHGSLDDVKTMIVALKRDLPEGVEILLDLPGNKIRTDNIPEPIPLLAGEPFV